MTQLERNLPHCCLAMPIGKLLCKLLMGLFLIGTAGMPLDAAAQTAASTSTPTTGLRRNPPTTFALQNAKVIIEPGRELDGATVLVEDQSITGVGQQLTIPAGAKRIDCSGKTIYAGLIDAYSEVDVPRSDVALGYWNDHIVPERSARSAVTELPSDVDKLRSQGITVRLVSPRDGIIKGSSSVMLLGGTAISDRLLREDVFTHMQLTVPRQGNKATARYPNSPMGAVALLRQSLLDAQWYRQAWQAYQSQPGLPRPETNRALQSLSQAMQERTFVADAPNERMAIRADQIAREFALNLVIRGSGREYHQLGEIGQLDETGQLGEIGRAARSILVPLAFPEPPNVTTLEQAREVTLRELMHWYLAPENPGRLVKAGISICLTTDGMQDSSKFLAAVRQAIDRGLSAEDALAALTTQPAKLLGVDAVAGRVAPGMLANLVVANGDLFSTSTGSDTGGKVKVLETWIAGERFLIESVSSPPLDRLVGQWDLSCKLNGKKQLWRLDLQQKGASLSGKLLAEPNAASEGDSVGESENARSVTLQNLACQRDRVSASFELSELSAQFAEGTWRMSWVILPSDSDVLADLPPKVFGSLISPAGDVLPLSVAYRHPEEAPQDSPSESESVAADRPAESENESSELAANESSETPSDASLASPILPHYPLGAYGFASQPDRPQAVLFRNTTIWTCSDAGVIEVGDLLVLDGKIAEVGGAIEPPDGCLVIDASGKHVTPGLIDCHSHMATDGGINESGQTITSEVRIGDFIDNSDIEIYRQLAGGLTIANVLHGSANPIGGQNQVIKLRWGGSMDQLRMREAPQGIKFALGENVKRNPSRYPNTRMGVEQIIRDQFLAAREYAATWRRWNEGHRDGLPPRRDLQLEALAEIQRGQRWIHCHSYRQDEIVATLDVLEEFGIQIGTLQHILEGYKVADRMAQHGAMASSFSDWWAYKFEVYDAIPYNGVLMHDAGVVVSYNSDDRELARRLNTEAAKAVKYGGVPEEEALKFVTTNPAKQLRIDQYVGTLEAGKQADLVLWSGPPLSTTTRCEQTWIDGRRYFDIEADRTMRLRDAALHAKLSQMVLRGPEKNSPTKSDSSQENASGDSQRQNESWTMEEDRWVRYDIYCNARGSQVSEQEKR